MVNPDDDKTVAELANEADRAEQELAYRNPEREHREETAFEVEQALRERDDEDLWDAKHPI